MSESVEVEMCPGLGRPLVIGIVLGLVVLLNGLSAAQVRAAEDGLSDVHKKSASAPVNSTPSCYVWDFLNNSGVDADGLVIQLKGINSITDVYTGVLNPFVAPGASSGYDSVADVYSLVFRG